MEMKEVHRLWAKVNRCGKMQNNTDLQLGLREQGVAATIPNNLDARSPNPFNPCDTCGLNHFKGEKQLNVKPILRNYV